MADTGEEKPKSVRKLKIMKSDIDENLLGQIEGYLNAAMDASSIEKDIATVVKKNCDTNLQGTWHCICGRNFGCSITHDTRYVLFLSIDELNVLLFRSLE